MSDAIRKKKKKWPWVLGGIAVVVIALVLLVSHQVNSMKALLSQDLSTTELKKTSLEDSISASGDVASSTSVNVTSSLNYIVRKVNVKVGDKVSKGEVLAVLDKSDLQKTVDEYRQSYDSAVKQFNLKVSQAKQSVSDAKDNVSQAKSDLEKAKKAYAGAAGDAAGSAKYNARYNNAETQDQVTKTAKQTLSTAQSTLTQAKNTYDSTVASDTTTTAKEQLQTAEENLAKATVKAPVSGIVSTVNVTVGNTPSGGSPTTTGAVGTGTTGTGAGTGTAAAAGSGSALFTIQSDNDFTVKASVADYDVIKLKTGKEVSITIDSTSEAFTGKILTISPVANSSGNYDITVSIDNPSKGSLRAGMQATVKIVLKKKSDIYAVPVDAIVKRGGKTYVVELTSTNVRRMKKNDIEVTTGMQTDYYTQISGSGLKDGLQILTDPLNKLKVDTTVTKLTGLGGGRNSGGK